MYNSKEECIMGLLSGLDGLGLDGLENMDIFENTQKEKKQAQEPPKVEEKDLIYEKNFKCPVCDGDAPAKIMKTGKAKLIGTDQDLRAKYEGIDAVKYDVVLCPTCGYTALTRFFPSVTSVQAKLIKEKISASVKIPEYKGETYSYEEAAERYKLALVNAVVKHAKASEKAYICLKSAWLMRGYAESLQESGKTDNIAALSAQEEEYLKNAYNGFVEARQNEGFPMCGMDEVTIDYLLAVLAFHHKKFDVASHMVSSILTSPAANTRMKDKARDLKEEIMAELKKK